MLTMRKRLLSFVLVGVLFASTTVALIGIPASNASAADGCYVDRNGMTVCPVETGDPGTPGGGGATGQPAAFIPGPTECTYPGAAGQPATVVPCQTPDGWWSVGFCRYGYVSLQSPQLPPGNHNPQVGAWYWCTPYCPAAAAPGGRDCFGASFWSDTPPPGIDVYTPAQAAGLARNLLTLTAINIGMAPAEKVHSDDPVGAAPYRRTWVGIPVWLWVDSPTEQTVGPQAVTATYGGVTVTVTAVAGQVVWDSGGGQSAVCGLGTPFNVAVMANKVAVDSPTCGYRYQKHGEYTATATTSWTVQWTGGGENGAFAAPTTTTSTVVQVGQLQSVNTPVTESMLQG